MKPISHLLVLAALCLTPLACTDKEGAPTPSGSNVDPALVGVWIGEINGTGGGLDTLTLTLKADGSMSGGGTTTFYCTGTGRWRVRSNEVRISLVAGCADVSITLVAPAMPTRLTGTWSSSLGFTGTFSVEKQ